jgi:O-antigen ligase
MIASESALQGIPVAHTQQMRDLPLLLVAACLAVAWLLPNHYFPWSSFHQEALAALGGVILLAGAALAYPRVRWPRLAILFLLASTVPCIQYAAAMIAFRSDAMMAALYLVGVALAIVVGANVAMDRPAALLDSLFGALLFAGIVSTGLALCQWLGLTGLGVYIADVPPGSRPFANVGQPNHLATLLVWSVLALLLWFEQRRISLVGLLLGCGWLLIGLALTQSRTAWLVAVLLPLWAFVMRRRVLLRSQWPWLALGGIVMGALVLVAEPVSKALLLQGGSLEGRLQAGTRLTHWLTLGDALLQAPWFGYGWNQIAVAQQATALRHSASQEVIEHSHNIILDLLLWNGIPIGGLLVIALAFWLWRAGRHCRTPQQWVVLAAIGSVFVHALLEYPLEYAYMLLPAGLLIGFADQSASTSSGARAASRWTLAVPGALLATLGCLVGMEYARAEQGVRDMRFVLAGYGDRIEDIKDLELPLLDGLREYHRYARTLATAGMQTQQLEWMRKVAQRFPYPPSLLRYAVALGLNGHPQGARDVLALLCKTHPRERCEEGREAWAALQVQYQSLRVIEMPASP